MKAGKILAGVLVAIGVVAFLSVIIVKEVNQAIILQFGDPKRIIKWTKTLQTSTSWYGTRWKTN